MLHLIGSADISIVVGMPCLLLLTYHTYIAFLTLELFWVSFLKMKRKALGREDAFDLFILRLLSLLK